MEDPFTSNATSASPQASVIYKVNFKTILDPKGYYKNTSTHTKIKQLTGSCQILHDPTHVLHEYLTSMLFRIQIQSIHYISSCPNWR